jgi:GNAT superfamily N-acetyltransferase
MKLTLRSCNNEEDYWRIRSFLREVFLLNDRLEHSWNVARLDYWRWHLIQTCHVCESVDKGMSFWETANGKIAAALNDLGDGEIRMHVHPHLRSAELENEMLAYAEEHYPETTENAKRLIAPVFADDTVRPEVLTRREFTKRPGWNHHFRRDLTAPLPVSPSPGGYTIRSMGDESEHAARSRCSWRAFHSDEPDSDYDGDFSWYRNIQSAPLYRRDLDIVAARSGEIAGFCTIYYDDYTRSAATVLVGIAVEHWRRGLGKAILLEGLRRLKHLGCTRVFSTANDAPADALYRSVMQQMKVTDTWVKEWQQERRP